MNGTDHSPSGTGSEVPENPHSDTRTEPGITADTSTTHDSSDREQLTDELLEALVWGEGRVARSNVKILRQLIKADREAAVLEVRIDEATQNRENTHNADTHQEVQDYFDERIAELEALNQKEKQ